MKISYAAQNPTSDEAVRRATGKSWQEWFVVLDEFGGPDKGRKALNELLIGKHKVDAWWTTTLIVEYEKVRRRIEKGGYPKGYTICATRAIKAKSQQLFEAFSTSDALARRFGAGSRVEFREGGSFSNPDGNRGQIRKINPGRALRLTWEGERHAPVESVEVKFQPGGARCTVIITHDRLQSRETADGMRAAWGAALDSLKALFEEAGGAE